METKNNDPPQRLSTESTDFLLRIEAYIKANLNPRIKLSYDKVVREVIFIYFKRHPESYKEMIGEYIKDNMGQYKQLKIRYEND